MALRKTENEALKDFIEIAESYNKKIHTGQSIENRIPINKTLYYQFGDLRVEMQDFTLIIETEGAGGVSNLVKYWYCFENNMIKKPIILLHLYQQASINDYGSHLLLWNFLWERMQITLNKKKINIKAELFPCYEKAEQERAKSIFKEYLLNEKLE